MLCQTKNGSDYCKSNQDEQFCNGTCPPAKPVKCGNVCLESNDDDDFYDCDGKCIPGDYTCNGKCREDDFKACGFRCIPANFTDNQVCDGLCIVRDSTCKGKCPFASLPIKCANDCKSEKEKNSFYECNNECYPMDRPCKGEMPPADD